MQESRDSINDIWGQRTPYDETWPERVDERFDEQPDKWVQSVYVLCSNGCAEVDIMQMCKLLGSWSREMAAVIEPFIDVYEGEQDDEPDRLTKTLMKNTRSGGMALLRDLHDLYLIVEVDICCTILKQGALALRDKSLADTCVYIAGQTYRQSSWLQTRMKSATPQTLVAQ